MELLQRVPMRKIADKYGCSLSAVARHKGHIPTSIAMPEQERQTGDVMRRISDLDQRVDEIYQKAALGNDSKLALRALKELRGILELYSRLTGELQSGVTHNTLVVSPEWLATRAVMLKALQPYPEARKALVEALGGSGSV